ncbi:HEAT repeat domain-containing protein [Pendulispora albinea]|uniref:HEAT repeat domain-containing protein n=1 Tax=Pendulispora albinea TaxID=2741071 RepID=A0ABZ2M0S9_9BACT
MLLVLAVLALSGSAGAQRKTPRPAGGGRARPATAEARGLEPTADLKAHFGLDLVERLLRSPDADDRLRGILRAETLGTPEAMARLVDAADTSGPSRTDSRAMVEIARALAPFADRPAARAALVNLVNAPNPSTSNRVSSSRADDASGAGDADQLARLEMARGTAALALAATGDALAEKDLFTIVRTGGAGQKAALSALAAYPPKGAALLDASLVTPAIIRLAVRTGDLRSLDALRQAARSMDPLTRAAGIAGLGEMGDGRGAAVALAGMGDGDPRVRAASAKALVLLDAPERFAAVKKLIGDDATLAQGIELARSAQDDAVSKQLLVRIDSPIDVDAKRAAVAALGCASHATQALSALGAWLATPLLAGDAAHALARSPMREARSAIDKALADPATRRLGVRAALVRVLVRGDRERTGVFSRTIAQMAEARDGAERALGVFARLTLGEGSLEKGLADPDPRVRRAAVLASLSDAQRGAREHVLERFARERDPATRTALLAGLAFGDDAGRVTTLELRARAEAKEPDAPLAALVLAQRGDAKEDANVNALLGSSDPLLRAHAARGLGTSAAPDAVGRLAAAYAYEPDPGARYAMLLAIASRTGRDLEAPARRETLRTASRLDPDDAVRDLAARTLQGAPPPRPATPSDVSWLRATGADGGKPPPEMLATLVRADGLALPIVFDDEGYALVPGVPAGTGRLILAPRLPSYEAARP